MPNRDEDELLCGAEPPAAPDAGEKIARRTQPAPEESGEDEIAIPWWKLELMLEAAMFLVPALVLALAGWPSYDAPPCPPPPQSTPAR